MNLRSCPAGLFLLLAACGPGLRSYADGGVPPEKRECMSTLADDRHLPAPSGADTLTGVRALAFDDQGQLWVLNRTGATGPAMVLVFSSAPHRLLRSFGQGLLTSAVDFALGPDRRVYVLQSDPQLPANARVAVFDEQGTAVGGFSVADAGYDEAFSLGFVSSDQLVVGADRLLRFDTSGTLKGAFGSPGTDPGLLGWPRGVAGDPRGPLWVADLAKNKVLQFDLSTGQVVLEFGGRGTEPGRFDGHESDPLTVWGPSRLALDADGNLYVNDPNNSRLQKLSRTGAGLGQFDFGGSQQVGAVAIDPTRGFVYVGRTTAVDIVCPL